MKLISKHHSKNRHSQRGSISIETALLLPVLIILTLAAADIFQLLRVEQKLTNINYNITQMVTTKKTLASQREIEKFHFYTKFAQQQLNQTIPGEASLVIERYSAENLQVLTLLQSGGACNPTAPWPDLRIGTLIRVTLCFQPDQSVYQKLPWSMWPASGFKSHFIQEVH
ncbi:TadE/TadG family type IV pilus assembly protein [Psychromonas sp. Urea-02u-13]|uniref:TadE/TadG family type IV pilus assembly protein n=1 Tax=Psychromonas sp. Urea-02u-13 TaxID=2058326 RepID=UPI000C34BEAE|nr:TadE/TadG family type IV pilus assembly protein [Psychromonas sp. Urea-02u-13]PKG40167.1 pilus assembly protein FlpK [Psychromonas sp. Urea-02u-13]